MGLGSDETFQSTAVVPHEGVGLVTELGNIPEGCLELVEGRGDGGDEVEPGGGFRDLVLDGRGEPLLGRIELGIESGDEVGHPAQIVVCLGRWFGGIWWVWGWGGRGQGRIHVDVNLHQGNERTRGDATARRG